MGRYYPISRQQNVFREAKPKETESLCSEVMRAFPERLAKLLYGFPKDR